MPNFFGGIMKLLIVFLLFPGLLIAGPKEDILFIFNDMRSLISGQSKNIVTKKPQVQVPNQSLEQIVPLQAPKFILSRLAVHAFNVVSIQSLYKSTLSNSRRKLYIYGVTGPKDIQIKFTYSF